MDQFKNFRPLLPRPPLPQGAPEPDKTLNKTSRKPHARNACEGCRRRKIKCSGERPICSACTRNAHSCVYITPDPNELRSSAIKRKYDEAQDQVSSHEEFYMLIKTRSHPEVAEMIRRIRAGIDVESVLRHVKDGDLLLQLRLVPETRLRYAFPDFATWPTLFRDPDDPYLKTPLLDFHPGLRSGDVAASARYNCHIYQMPYHAAHMVDPRLSSVKASTWTTVTTDDALVSKLLAIYFQHEYAATRMFQKDLFLDDLARGNTTSTSFCSPLLVNAILANAAHGFTGDPHRVEFWTPRALPYAFLAEAKRLWDMEIMDEPKLTTIHASMALSLRYSSDGADRIGMPLLAKAVELAERMELFTKFEKGDSKMSLGRAYTAWALFTWQTVTLYYQLKLPLVMKPPNTILPERGSWRKITGEIYLKYPLQATLTPIHLGASFEAQIGINLIMHDINTTLHSAEPHRTAQLTLRQTLDFYKRLEAWYKALPPELLPHRIAMPHDLQVHMEYHLVIINLFEPWISGHSTNPDPDADLLVVDGLTFLEIGTRARARLETLVRVYYLRHSFDALDVASLMFLLLLGSISVRVLGAAGADGIAGKGEQHHDASTFLLCAKGLHDQGRNYYLAAMMFDMLAGLVDPQDQRLVADVASIRAEFRGIEVRPEHVHMAWPVYRWIHPENERMDKLLGAVEELGVGEESEEEGGE